MKITGTLLIIKLVKNDAKKRPNQRLSRVILGLHVVLGLVFSRLVFVNVSCTVAASDESSSLKMGLA